MAIERTSTLIEYLEENKDKPFSWPDHNCFSFTSNYVKKITGSPLFPEGYVFDNRNWKQAFKSQKKFFQDYGHNDIADYIDTKFQREFTLYPGDGLIVAGQDPFGRIFGVTFEGYCFFLTEKDGLLGIEPKAQNIYWRVE